MISERQRERERERLTERFERERLNRDKVLVELESVSTLLLRIRVGILDFCI